MRKINDRKFKSLFVASMLLGQMFLLPSTPRATMVVNQSNNRISFRQASVTTPQNPTPSFKPNSGSGFNGPGTSTADNGITVGQPKEFDERTLTLMLQDLQDKLTRSQFPDPTGLYGATGRFGGATASTTSMAVSVRGPSTPSIQTTVGSTSKDTSTDGTTVGTTRTTAETDEGTTSSRGRTNSKTSGTSSEATTMDQQITTQPSFAPPAPVAPGQTSLFSYQPQFGISAQDLFTEQTALFYQIVNLRLLLDRSFTDRLKIIYDQNGNSNSWRRDQIVVGFQISIDAAYKDAVAEAEISVSGSEVSLVSLMPKDKTYNVASVTKDAKAIDLGAVAQFIGVGASVGKTQESLYLVKDTDTVALERHPQNGTVKFAWQFRPVLGRRTVEPGVRQVYALLSMPAGAGHDLKVTATTKWRHYDRKTKIVGSTLNRTEQDQYTNAQLMLGGPFRNEFALKPSISKTNWNDIGNGQVLVVVEGEGFTPDTTIVLGNDLLNGPAKGLTIANERRLIVVTQGELLAQSPSPPTVVGRYGTTNLERPKCQRDANKPQSAEDIKECGSGGSYHVVTHPYSDLTLQPPVIKARDAQTSEVTFKLVANSSAVSIRKLFEQYPPVVVVGGKVFGLSNAPFILKDFDKQTGFVELGFLASTQLLANSKKLIFKEFLWNDGELTANLSVPSAFSVTGVMTLGSNGEKTQLAIAGANFTKDVKVQVGETLFALECKGEPRCVPGLKLNTLDGSATVITLSPTKAQIKDVKLLLVMQGTAHPQSVALATPPPSTPTAKIIAPSELKLGEGDSVRVKFEGANFDSIEKVTFEGEELVSKPDDEDKAVRWVEITTFVTRQKGKKRIVFVMKDEKEVPFTVIVQ